MIGVWASPSVARPIAVAVDSLAARAVPATSAGGALAAVGGAQWCQAALAALHGGARAIFVLHPVGGSAAELAELRVAAGDRPVVVERRRRPSPLADQVSEISMRDDAAGRSGAARPSLIEVDVCAPDGELHDALADAVSWIRVLAGTADLRLVDHSATRYGAIARLSAMPANGGGGHMITATATATAVRAGAGVLRATVLAPTRVEVEIDLDARTQTIAVTDDRGATTFSPHVEDPVRYALRRAIDRVGGPDVTDDLDLLRRDRASSEVVLGRSVTA